MNEIEHEQNSQIVAKKLWKLLRAVFFVMGKGISKSKHKFDLQHLLHRGNEIAEKTIDNLILHHNQLSCRPDDPSLSFISPREYEFSCSASPAANKFPSSHFINHYKRKHHHRHHYRHIGYRQPPRCYEPRDMKGVNAAQKVLVAINKNSETSRVQPGSPWFGELSPDVGRHVRQLRITDSPFSMNNDCEEDQTQLNMAADEFIAKFYTELKYQNKKADVFESRYYDTWYERTRMPTFVGNSNSC